ncbi:6-pyruvoyl-tetrahydropterin synthase-related protein [Ectobacillus sp. sgz5001026]|uniref:6-pyruvoyl-tetrahydropterin synthase-related protein n=1 Tax=Ectobacillus sp. sgz5001026 TaxID=3242473 RepID=UPI0036D271D9
MKLNIKSFWLWNIAILFVFFILSIFSNSLLFDRGIPVGADQGFHMLRIQGLTDSIKSGNWYPYINMRYLDGFGYAVDTFYSNTFLYIASFYQIFVKDNAVQAYKFLLLVITFLTFVFAYLSAKGITQSRMISLFASILYTLSSYHFIDTFNRAALGETIAFAFVPVVLSSFYMMVYRQKNVWYWLVVGMCALVLSHIVSTLMASTVLFVLFIVSFHSWKKNPIIVVWIGIAAIFVVGLTIFMTLPLYEQMQAQPLISQWAPVFNVPDTGVNLGDTIIHSINNEDARSGVMNIGILVLLAPIIRLLIFEKKIVPGDYFTISGFLTLIVCTKLFPWMLFRNTPLNAVQFPWRYMVFVTFLLAVGSAFYLGEMLKRYDKKWLVFVVFFGSVIITNVSLLYQTSFEVREPSAETILENTANIGIGKEYLPTGVRLSDITPDSGPLYVNENVHYSNFKKNGSHISFDYNNTNEGEIAMPIIYYKGYQAQIKENGTSMNTPVYAGVTNLATLELPKGTGTVNFYYAGTTIQKLSKILSGVFFLAFGIVLVYEAIVRRKKVRTEKSPNE